jgi:hypothetical protein
LKAAEPLLFCRGSAAASTASARETGNPPRIPAFNRNRLIKQAQSVLAIAARLCIKYTSIPHLRNVHYDNLFIDLCQEKQRLSGIRVARMSFLHCTIKSTTLSLYAKMV